MPFLSLTQLVKKVEGHKLFILAVFLLLRADLKLGILGYCILGRLVSLLFRFVIMFSLIVEISIKQGSITYS